MVKINILRQGTEVKDIQHVYTFPSESNPGQEHIAFKSASGIHCSCIGFHMNSYCWHTRWIAENA